MNAETPVHTPARKHVILFLAANPVDLRKVALDREARDIQVELERSGHRDCFEFVTRWAAEPSDLLRELRKLKPTVVHFSGHGTAVLSEGRAVNVGTRDVIEPCARGDPADSGLCFQGPDGRAQIVRAEALAEAFGSVRSHVKLVVLNACYSDAQATALLSHVDCVIGMRGAIQDDAARSFAIGFYGGLGERESVGAAYLQGRASISLGDLADSDRPKLRTRSGVDADQLVLATPSLRRPVRSARSGSAIAFAAIAVALSIAVLAGRAWFAKDLHADAARLVKEGWTRLSGLETESAVMALQQSVALDPGASLSRAALAVAHA